MAAAAGLLTQSSAARAQSRPVFDGQAALAATQKAVDFGPRAVGSPSLRRYREWLEGQLRSMKCELQEDSWTESTPRGPRSMTNVIAKFPGATGAARRIVVLSGHYDTYSRPGLYFLGANDGGSSSGILLQLARTIARTPHKDTIWIVWLDGEESLVQWSGDDHTYGSRHLARKWKADGTAPSILALINVDMIGDSDLSLLYEMNSTAWLRDLVWSVAARLGYSAPFSRSRPSAISDDHLEFLGVGIPTLDIIDLDYGPDNGYWHTPKDTMDKLSARSLQIIGEVVLETVRVLEQRSAAN